MLPAQLAHRGLDLDLDLDWGSWSTTALIEPAKRRREDYKSWERDRLTRPASSTTTGKVEWFHQTLRRDLLADHEPFEDLDAVQASLDAWVAGDYNTRRPHQSLDIPTPFDRCGPLPEGSAKRCLCGSPPP